MSEPSAPRSVRTLPLAAALLWAFPVVDTFVRNATRLRPELLLRPLLLALLVGAGGAWLGGRVLRHRVSGALVAGAAAMAFWFFEPMLQASRVLPDAAFGLGLVALVVATLLGMPRLGGWLERRPGRADTLAGVLWIAALVLAGPGLVGLGGVAVAPAPAQLVLPPPPDSPAPASKGAPDVLVLLLDGYARDDILARRFGHDNAGFLAMLDAKGFTVARRAQSPYPDTFWTIPVLWNLDHPEVPEALAGQGGRLPDERPLLRLLEDPRLPGLFMEAGYRTRLVRGGAPVPRSDAFEEVVEGGPTDLEQQLFSRSALGILRQDWQEEAHRVQVRRALDAVPTPPAPGDERPSFTFSHVMLPHPPFLIPDDGLLPSLSYFTYWDRAEKLDALGGEGYYRAGFVRQTRWLNDAVMRLLARVEASGRPTLVLLLSDHGPRGRGSGDGTPAGLRERLGILLALGGIGVEAPRLAPGDGSLQAMRRLVNAALGVELEVGEARSFTYPDGFMYQLAPVPQLGRDGGPTS